MRYRRTERVGELLVQEISQILNEKAKDPRIGFVTILRVEASPDLKSARVFVSIMENDQRTAETLTALEHAAPFIQHEIGQRLELKFIPRLRFIHDRSIQHYERIQELLDKQTTDSE